MSVQGKHVQNGTYEFDYMRQPDTRTKMQIFKDGIYNPQEGSVLGRTAKQWGITGLFYGCFFLGLAIFFSIYFKIWMSTLSEDRPKWILDSSVIGSSPGLGYRPISENHLEKSLIWYHAKNPSSVKTWVDRLDLFLEEYYNSSSLPVGDKSPETCSFERPPSKTKACKIDMKQWGPCSSENAYGFKDGTPCIFIKLNKIYGWIPQYYNNTNELPEDMPEDLKKHIANINMAQRNSVWVSCRGENPHDRESINEFKYYPQSPQGFPGYYFPYENQKGYLSPLVAVQLTNVEKSILINIECRAWAKNIKYSSHRSERIGQVHFEVMIDMDDSTQ